MPGADCLRNDLTCAVSLTSATTIRVLSEAQPDSLTVVFVKLLTEKLTTLPTRKISKTVVCVNGMRNREGMVSKQAVPHMLAGFCSHVLHLHVC